MTALVLGATGFLGINLVDALQRSGSAVRCGRRRRSNVLPLRSRRVPLVIADLDDDQTLIAAMQGADVVYHLAGHYPRTSLDHDATVAVGCAQTTRVLDAAAAAGVRRLVYVSSTATVAKRTGGASTESDVFDAPPGFGTYHDLKWTMEQRVLQERRFEVVVALPSACIGPWDLRVGTSALLVGVARGLDPAYPDGIVNLVDVRDVADALVRLGQAPRPPPRILLGAWNRRLQPLLQALADRYGVPPPSPPIGAAEAIIRADAEEAAATNEHRRPNMSREIVDLIVHGPELDPALAEAELGMRWRDLDTTLDAFDAWARRMRIIPETPTAARQTA